MILTELYTGAIPTLYKRFASVVGEQHWQAMANVLRDEVRGTPVLNDYLADEFDITLQFAHLQELTDRFGAVPVESVNDHGIYPAATIMAQLLSIIDVSSPTLAKDLIRRFHGAIRNPSDMRAFRLELMTATHFVRRGNRIRWPKVSTTGTCDLLVEDLGTAGLEIECKSFHGATGRKVGRREALLLFEQIKNQVTPMLSGLTSGLSLVLRIKDRLPTDRAELLALAIACKKHLISAKSGMLMDGAQIQVTEFQLTAQMGNIKALGDAERRQLFDKITGTSNREIMLIGMKGGGLVAFAIQSMRPDQFVERMHRTLSKSANRQFTKTRPGLFVAGLCSLTGAQLLSIAKNDNSSNPPSVLPVEATRLLSNPTRSHLAGIVFLAETALSPATDGVVESGGTAYSFPNRESSFWHPNLLGLFGTT